MTARFKWVEQRSGGSSIKATQVTPDNLPSLAETMGLPLGAIKDLWDPQPGDWFVDFDKGHHVLYRAHEFGAYFEASSLMGGF